MINVGGRWTCHSLNRATCSRGHVWTSRKLAIILTDQHHHLQSQSRPTSLLGILSTSALDLACRILIEWP